MYGKTFFGDGAKADVEDMIHELLEVYDQRLANADWLTEETREYARQKLTTMDIRAGYPDSLDDWWYTLDASEETCATDMAVYLYTESFKYSLQKVGQTVDRGQWPMTANTVNACYLATDNSITFPAAILQEPFYSASYSREQNLGGIGVVIGHEISHAFDTNTGSKYDAYGNMVNWWTEEDAAAFAERSAKVEARYSSIEALPGEYVHGDLTIGETVADLGGMAATLDLMAGIEDADYDAYFRQFATIWACVETKEYLSGYLLTNTHAPSYLRADITVQQFEEFYETYDIPEGSAMYTAPEDRLKVW